MLKSEQEFIAIKSYTKNTRQHETTEVITAELQKVEVPE
jgi:hypothetical protein